MVNDSQKLGWADYSAPRVVLVKGKYSIEVSIPRAIRHLFGRGKGGSTNLRRATGTTDLAIAEKKKMLLGQEIYKVMDQKQIEVQQVGLNKMTDFAIHTLMELAKAFNYHRGNIPVLDPKTDYLSLQKMKATLDSYTQFAEDQDNVTERTDAALQIVMDTIGYDAKTDDPKIPNGILTAFMSIGLPVELTLSEYQEKWLLDEELHRMVLEALNAPSGSALTAHQEGLLDLYNTEVVHSFFEDLLTTAAKEQGFPSPVFQKVQRQKVVELDGDIFTEINFIALQALLEKELGDEPLLQPQQAERNRQVKQIEELRISDVRDSYFAQVEKEYDKPNTKNKMYRGVNLFLKLVGDYRLSELTSVQAYIFIEEQLEVQPNLSQRTIVDRNWQVSSLLTYCVQKGYIKQNPFREINFKRKGKQRHHWQGFTPLELDRIFTYDWEPQERLLLCIKATTGLRLSEVGCLTWECFNVDDDGIRTFTVLKAKNIGSKRIVPLHPTLVLPPQGEGRLFDYPIDGNGLCSTSAGAAINPILAKLIPDPLKSAHSFRRTLKNMFRDAGISKEINDIYTGHGQGDVASTSYGGASIKTRYEAISRLKFPWLKQF